MSQSTETCGRLIPFTNDRCGRDGVVCEWCQNVDERWLQALVGLPCLAFVARDDAEQRRSQEARGVPHAVPRKGMVPLPYVAEITGMEGNHVFVLLPDEEEPRRMHFTNIRPLAPGRGRAAV